MGSAIKRPALASTSPPFFEVHPGHSVKVLVHDQPRWVKVLSVEGDELLGIVTDGESSTHAQHLRWRDVIEFRHCNVFGLY